MTPSTDLFDLIKAMTPLEKRYFKVFASKHVIGDSNNYMLLFDAIEAQEVYDEEAIKEHFKKEKFVKHLPYEKNYLFHQLLDCLHVYHMNIAKSAELKKELHQAVLMLKMGLMKPSIKMIKKLKDKAKEMEDFSSLLEVMQVSRDLYRVKGFLETSGKELSIQSEEELDALNKLKNQREYEYLYDRLHFVTSHIQHGNMTEQKKLVNAIMNNALLQDESDALSVRSRYIFNHIHYLYNLYIIEKLETANIYLKKSIRYGEISLEKTQNYNAYIASLLNYFLLNRKMKNFDESFDTLKKVRGLKDKYPQGIDSKLQARIFLQTYNYETDTYIKLAEFARVNEIAPEIDKGLSLLKFKGFQASLGILNFNLAIMFHGCGDFRKSLKYLNNIITEDSGEIRKDVYNISWVMNLVIHYDMDNMDIIPYLLKTTRKFLNEHKTIFRGETIMIELMQNLRKARNSETEKKLLNAAREEFVKLKEDNYENKIFEFFDFISWFDSKLSNRNFAAICREGVAKRTF